mmetsp:Transcript_12520/g.29422  ORF Transcript_12520/g.29422 Transcript_12520/m.29422 type:complete len:314 (+) Transcript_12520:767-1708(+)
MYLPLGFHFYLVFFFGGFSLFTTLLVALKLREMSRSVGIGRGGGYTARSIWGYYRCTIFTGFLVFVFIGEFASGLLFAIFTELAPPLQVFLFVIFTISQLFLAIYFIFQAWSMASPLVAYIEHPESNPGQEELRRIKAFVNWIVISGVSMIINTVSNLFILIGVSTAGAGKFASPLGLFFASALCAYSRIMISFSQLKLVAPGRPKNSYCWNYEDGEDSIDTETGSRTGASSGLSEVLRVDGALELLFGTGGRAFFRAGQVTPSSRGSSIRADGASVVSSLSDISEGASAEEKNTLSSGSGGTSSKENAEKGS